MSNNALGKASLILSTDNKQLDTGLKDGQDKIGQFVNRGQQLVNGFSKVGDFIGTYLTGGVKKSLTNISSMLQGQMQGLQGKLAGQSGAGAAMASAALPIVGAIVQGIGMAGTLFEQFRAKATEIFADIAGKARQASQLGIGAESFQELLAGARVDADTLTASMGHLQREVSGLGQGGQQATQVFSQLGLTTQDFAGANAADQFRTVAAALQQVPNEADRARLAFQLFGRSSRELMPALREGLDAGIDRARELGLIVSNDDVNSIKAMNRAWKEVGQIQQGIWTQLSTAALPMFLVIAQGAQSLWRNIGPLFNAGVDIIRQYFAYLKAKFDELMIVLQPVIDAVRQFFGGSNIDTSGFMDLLARADTAMTQFYASIYNTLLGIAQGFLTNLVAPALRYGAMFVDALSTLVPPVVSVVNWILNAITELGKGYLRYLVAPAFDAAAKVVEAFQSLVPGLVAVFNAAISAVQDFLRAVIVPIIEGVRTAVRAVYNTMNDIPEVIRDRIPGFNDLMNGVDAVATGLATARDNVRTLSNTPIRLNADAANTTLDGIRGQLDAAAAAARATADGLQPFQLNAEDIQGTLTQVANQLRQAGVNADWVAEMLDDWTINPDDIDDFFRRVVERARRAAEEVQDDMEAAFQEPLNKEMKQANVALFGSKEAANVIYQAQFGGQNNDPQERMVAAQNVGNQIAGRVANAAERLVALAQNQEVGVI